MINKDMPDWMIQAAEMNPNFYDGDFEDQAEEENVDPGEISTPPAPPDPPLKAEQLLDDLAAYRIDLENLATEKKLAIAKVIPIEVRQKMNEIEVEYAPSVAAGNNNIAKLESQIKAACVLNKATIKGRMLQAIYSGGRDSWDTKALMRYGKDHPEIMQFYKPGEPYCLRIEKIRTK